jgi:hypothetical protein
MEVRELSASVATSTDENQIKRFNPRTNKTTKLTDEIIHLDGNYLRLEDKKLFACGIARSQNRIEIEPKKINDSGKVSPTTWFLFSRESFISCRRCPKQ